MNSTSKSVQRVRLKPKASRVGRTKRTPKMTAAGR
jgi:hypothetical protein